MTKPHVYMASKLKHAEKWRDLSLDETDILFVARWPYITGHVPDSAVHAQNFWINDCADVERCDFLICYSEKNERPVGQLIEVGYAMALDKKVIIVGDNVSFSTWTHHPSVFKARNLDVALLKVKNLI